MASWTSLEDRRRATDVFCTYLDQDENASARARCMIDPCYAKHLFNDLGQFEDMPDNVRFCCVVEGQPEDIGDAGDEIVFMSLYPRGELPNPVEPKLVWRCTYQPYQPGN